MRRQLHLWKDMALLLCTTANIGQVATDLDSGRHQPEESELAGIFL